MTLGDLLQRGALTAAVARHIAAERLVNPRPATLCDVPPTPLHVTDRWLTLALCRDVPGASVLAHTLGPRDDGTSSRRTLSVEFNDAGRAAGLTERLFTKSAPSFMTRLASVAVGLGVIETSFYSQLRPAIGIEAPTTQYCAYDPRTGRILLILDDVSHTRGASFGDIVTRRLTLAQAEQVVDTLAALHSRFWNVALRNRFGNWLPDSHEWMTRLNVTINARERILVGFDRARDSIPPELYDRRHEVPAALMRSLQINTSGPQTLLHGDVHPGNWYVAADGSMGLYDWQCVVRGGWARDVAYALATHLTVEQRRQWEHHLIARHRQRVVESGCATATLDQCFLAYRQQIPHAMFMWLVTMGRYRLQPELQPPDVTRESVRRTCQAAVDLNSLDAIR